MVADPSLFRTSTDTPDFQQLLTGDPQLQPTPSTSSPPREAQPQTTLPVSPQAMPPPVAPPQPLLPPTTPPPALLPAQPPRNPSLDDILHAPTGVPGSGSESGAAHPRKPSPRRARRRGRAPTNEVVPASGTPTGTAHPAPVTAAPPVTPPPPVPVPAATPPPPVIQDPADPAASFLSAVLQQQPQTVYALLDENVTAQIPALGFTCEGRPETSAALGATLTAFSEVRYDLRHRYLSPGSLTDEVVLTARRHGHFLNQAPGDRPVQLQARIQIDHNGRTVTSVALWADRQALHDLIRPPSPGHTGVLSVVSALRASMPRQDARLTVGTSRQLPFLPTEAPGAAHGPGPLPENDPGAPDSRRPGTENSRRVQIWGLGAAVLVAGLVLATWTARTVLTDAKLSTPVSASATAPAATPAVEAPLPRGVVFSQDTRSYDLSSDVLFPPNSSELTTRAQTILDIVVDQVRLFRPTGVITVTGYTDSTGSPDYNLALSERRARAVAEVLARGLSDLPALSILPRGAGETGTSQDNDTPAKRAANRRVTVALPSPTKAQAHPPMTTSTAAASPLRDDEAVDES
jgi:outer membrane protein OmpA-like peptidoglycan-associated protein